MLSMLLTLTIFILEVSETKFDCDFNYLQYKLVVVMLRFKLMKKPIEAPIIMVQFDNSSKYLVTWWTIQEIVILYLYWYVMVDGWYWYLYIKIIHVFHLICSCHDIAEILLMFALNTNQSINQCFSLFCVVVSFFLL